jgi:two-component system OmpR family response regulator
MATLTPVGEVPMRVLVVEDSEKMVALLRRGLEEEGYAVDVAHDGDEALWFAGDHEYDTVVLDVVLDRVTPGLDGFEVCRRLRDGARWSPVLMLTARDAVEDRVRGLDAGADDYLTKPFAFEELYARVRALVRRGASERPAVLRVGDLSLDPARFVVHRGDRELELTAKEFALLECFMRHPGEVLGRTMLIQHVWDYAFDADSNVVDVHVRNLRTKIDRPFGRASLETVRGAGYRLRDETSDPASG